MSALFNFQSFLSLILLFICTCTYVKMIFPALLDRKIGFRGFFWKAARIVFGESTYTCPSNSALAPCRGERLSPWVSAGCFIMGIAIIFF